MAALPNNANFNELLNLSLSDPLVQQSIGAGMQIDRNYPAPGRGPLITVFRNEFNRQYPNGYGMRSVEHGTSRNRYNVAVALPILNQLIINSNHAFEQPANAPLRRSYATQLRDKLVSEIANLNNDLAEREAELETKEEELEEAEAELNDVLEQLEDLEIQNKGLVKQNEAYQQKVTDSAKKLLLTKQEKRKVMASKKKLEAELWNEQEIRRHNEQVIADQKQELEYYREQAKNGTIAPYVPPAAPFASPIKPAKHEKDSGSEVKKEIKKEEEKTGKGDEEEEEQKEDAKKEQEKKE